MKLAMVGLGKMGGNMAERLRRNGHDVVGFDAFAADKSDAASLEVRPSATRSARPTASRRRMAPSTLERGTTFLNTS